MEIISSNIDSEKISLATNSPVAGLTLSYGYPKLVAQFSLSDLNTTEVTITKEALGLKSLNNIYFKLHLFDTDIAIYDGLFHIDVENNKEKFDYDALDFKQELDNLNYYDGIVRSLTEKNRFLEANDFFFNYINFLEKKLNGNNIASAINRQIIPSTNDN